jgi:hypothetical protein
MAGAAVGTNTHVSAYQTKVDRTGLVAQAADGLLGTNIAALHKTFSYFIRSKKSTSYQTGWWITVHLCYLAGNHWSDEMLFKKSHTKVYILTGNKLKAISLSSVRDLADTRHIIWRGFIKYKDYLR